MSKKKEKKLLEIFGKDLHPGKIDTVELMGNKSELFSPGLEVVGGGTKRIPDEDLLAGILSFYSLSHP